MRETETAGTEAGTEVRLASRRTIMGWIESLSRLGARTPDSAAAAAAADLIRDALLEMGLIDVRIETTATVSWQAAEHRLKVAGQEIPCSPLYHSFTSGHPQRFATPPGGLQANMVYLGRGGCADFATVDVKGKIVLCDAPFARIRLQDYRETLYVHDPDGTHSDDYYFNCYDSPGDAFPASYYRAQEAGAVGYVGVLIDYYRERHSYANEAYAAYDGHPMVIPGLWLSAKGGEQVKALIGSASSGTLAALVLEGELASATSRIVVGRLPGGGPSKSESVIVDAHYDSISDGAVQDASGSAASLALADYFSRLPLDQRNRSLAFVFNDTHFTDYAAQDGFVERDLPGLDAVFAVSINTLAVSSLTRPWVRSSRAGPRIGSSGRHRVPMSWSSSGRQWSGTIWREWWSSPLTMMRRSSGQIRATSGTQASPS